MIFHIPFESESHAEQDAILNRTMDSQVMAICLRNHDEKVFSFTFRGFSCQGDFFRGAEKLHNLNHNFVVSNVVVEIF